MLDFIGRPLSDLLDYCNANKINYSIIENSYSKDESKDALFVTNVTKIEKGIIIVVSKFKIGV